MQKTNMKTSLQLQVSRSCPWRWGKEHWGGGPWHHTWRPPMWGAHHHTHSASVLRKNVKYSKISKDLNSMWRPTRRISSEDFLNNVQSNIWAYTWYWFLKSDWIKLGVLHSCFNACCQEACLPYLLRAWQEVSRMPQWSSAYTTLKEKHHQRLKLVGCFLLFQQTGPFLNIIFSTDEHTVLFFKAQNCDEQDLPHIKLVRPLDPQMYHKPWLLQLEILRKLSQRSKDS